MVDIPQMREYIEPQWRALKKFGTATLDELADFVVKDMGLTEEQTTPLHKNGPRTEYEYRMAWARTYLKQAGFSDNPRQGIWAVGFATKENRGRIKDAVGEETINVFVPTTPNPTSGFLLLFPKKDVIFLDLTFEEASKFVVSAGSINP